MSEDGDAEAQDAVWARSVSGEAQAHEMDREVNRRKVRSSAGRCKRQSDTQALLTFCQSRLPRGVSGCVLLEYDAAKPALVVRLPLECVPGWLALCSVQRAACAQLDAFLLAKKRKQP
jgi:hypothetical protein